MKNLLEDIIKQCEESEAERARKYKHNTCLMPCVKNKDDGPEKVKEEFREVTEAVEKFSSHAPWSEEDQEKARLRLASELVDLQFAAETALLSLGYNYRQRDEVRRMVYLKNKLRGYYDEQGE